MLLLLLLCQFLPCFSAPWSFIPGDGCGISKAIRTLKEFPEDFDGDLSSLACTYLIDDTNWKAYKASIKSNKP